MVDVVCGAYGVCVECVVSVLTSETKRESDSTEQLPNAWRSHTNTIGYPAYSPAHSERMRGRLGESSGRWDRDGTRGREARLTKQKQTNNKPSQKQSKRIQRGKREAEGESKHTSRASDGGHAGGPSGCWDPAWWRCTRRSEKGARTGKAEVWLLGSCGACEAGQCRPWHSAGKSKWDDCGPAARWAHSCERDFEMYSCVARRTEVAPPMLPANFVLALPLVSCAQTL